MIDDKLFGGVNFAGGDHGLDIGAVHIAGLDGAIVGTGYAHTCPEDTTAFQGNVETIGEVLTGDQSTELAAVGSTYKNAASAHGVCLLVDSDVQDVSEDVSFAFRLGCNCEIITYREGACKLS